MSRTTEYLRERVESDREVLRKAEAANDDEAIADLQANLMESQMELSNAEYYDSLDI